MQREILSVSALNQKSKKLLEGNFSVIWVEGEISNFARPASGHWYFTLKDNRAQIRCAMFKQANSSLNFLPENGMQLTLKVKVTLYEPRGDYQLICSYAEPAGDGKLLRDYELLKSKLDSEGLFSPEKKQSLPAFVSKIAIISSASGAALQDILHVLKRRAPTIEVTVFASSVQGEAASRQLLLALNSCINVHHKSPFDTLIIARGGGSLEDLYAFNNEQLARAIADCPIPTISAIGHEVDFSISDFVADVRAATPSVAAELISPEQQQWLTWLEQTQDRFYDLIYKNIQQKEKQILYLSQQILHPKNKLETMQQQLDDYSRRLNERIKICLNNKQQQQNYTHLKFTQLSPQVKVKAMINRVEHFQEQLQQLMVYKLNHDQEKLKQSITSLDLLSPLTIMSRGYALVNKENNELVKSKKQLNSGETISIRFSDGQVKTKVI